MSISRRSFLGTGTIAVLAAGLPAKALARELLSGSNFGSALGRHLDSRAFARYLNTEFLIRSSNGVVTPARLVEVKHWPGSPATPDTARECFSLVFSSSQQPSLPQDTVLVEHESLGKFPLLIVPVGNHKQGSHYEAVINRLHR